MDNYASATIEGFVTQDPTLKETKTGKSLCTFSLAINHFAGQDAEPKVSFVDVETWEKLAKLCSDNLKKGKRIMIFGNLRQDRWEGKDGKQRSKIKIVGNRVRFLESGRSQQKKDELISEAV